MTFDPHLTPLDPFWGSNGGPKEKYVKNKERSFNEWQNGVFPPNLVKIGAKMTFDPHLTLFDPS